MNKSHREKESQNYNYKHHQNINFQLASQNHLKNGSYSSKDVNQAINEDLSLIKAKLNKGSLFLSFKEDLTSSATNANQKSLVKPYQLLAHSNSQNIQSITSPQQSMLLSTMNKGANSTQFLFKLINQKSTRESTTSGSKHSHSNKVSLQGINATNTNNFTSTQKQSLFNLKEFNVLTSKSSSTKFCNSTKSEEHQQSLKRIQTLFDNFKSKKLESQGKNINEADNNDNNLNKNISKSRREISKSVDLSNVRQKIICNEQNRNPKQIKRPIILSQEMNQENIDPNIPNNNNNNFPIKTSNHDKNCNKPLQISSKQNQNQLISITDGSNQRCQEQESIISQYRQIKIRKQMIPLTNSQMTSSHDQNQFEIIQNQNQNQIKKKTPTQHLMRQNTSFSSHLNQAPQNTRVRLIGVQSLLEQQVENHQDPSFVAQDGVQINLNHQNANDEQIQIHHRSSSSQKATTSRKSQRLQGPDVISEFSSGIENQSCNSQYGGYFQQTGKFVSIKKSSIDTIAQDGCGASTSSLKKQQRMHCNDLNGFAFSHRDKVRIDEVYGMLQVIIEENTNLKIQLDLVKQENLDLKKDFQKQF